MWKLFQPKARWLRRARQMLVGFCCLPLCLSIGSGAYAQAPSKNSADALKAAYLFNFAKFTSWPEVDDLDITVQFCIQRDTLNAAAFDGWGRKQVQKRPVRVTFFDTFDQYQLSSCSIMFVGEVTEPADFEKYFDLAQESAILLVSDKSGFTIQGGQIELYLADRKLRFKVNLDSVNDAKISLGAGVLRLAEIVKTGGVR